MGRIPVLEDDKVKIYESGAILQYILAKYDNGSLAFTHEDPEFSEYLQWLHYAEGSIMQQVNTLVVETILLPPEKKNEVNVARALKLIKIALSNVNTRLTDREYLAGKFSGADIMTGHACYGAMNAGADISEFMHIQDYLERLLSRPAFKKAISL